jgi:hypothetical protein
MLKNGKISITQDEKLLLEEGKYGEVIEIYRNCIVDFMDVAQKRVSWDHKKKLEDHLCGIVKTFPEDVIYELVNKGYISPHSTKYKFELDKLNDKRVFELLTNNLSYSDLEKYYARAIANIQNPDHVKTYLDEGRFYQHFSTKAGFERRTTEFFLDRALSGNRSVRTYNVTLDRQVLMESKERIIANISTELIEIFDYNTNNFLNYDPDIYEACRNFAIYEEPAHLEKFVKHEDVSKYFDTVLAHHDSISNRVFFLMKSDYIRKNHALLWEKGDAGVREMLFKNKDLQDENEKFLIQNPKIFQTMNRVGILMFYKHEGVRVHNPEFVTELFKIPRNDYIRWDEWKILPDFRETILEKIKEEKAASKRRKRTSVLESGSTSDVIAKFLYEDHIESRIEQLVEETYHKYDTIIEDNIGRIIYNHVDMNGIIAQIQDKTFLRLCSFSNMRNVEYALYKEIGNFARGTDFFINNLKMIEKSIQQLRNVKKVVEG